MATRRMILWLCISSKELGNHFIITSSFTASPFFKSWNLVENKTRFQCFMLKFSMLYHFVTIDTLNLHLKSVSVQKRSSLTNG